MELKKIWRSKYLNNLYDRTSDHIVFGMIYSAPFLISQSDISFDLLSSPWCYPLYVVVVLSTLFTVSWFKRDISTSGNVGKTSEDLFKHLAEKMIIPIIFYCSLFILFSEPIPSIIYYGSVSYLLSLPILFAKKYYHWIFLPQSSN